jgi:hypothetical protein
LDKNLGITGEFTISIKDQNTDRERINLKVKNNITDAFFKSLIDSFQSVRYFSSYVIDQTQLGSLLSSNISISTSDKNYGKHINILDQIIATAETNTDILGPKVGIIDRTDSSPLFIEYKQRILSTEAKYGSGNGFDRFFRTICLSLSTLRSNIDHTENGAASFAKSVVYAYAVLDSDCEQKANEIVDVTYRLQIPDDNSKYFADYLALKIFNNEYIDSAYKQRSISYFPSEDYKNIFRSGDGYKADNTISVLKSQKQKASFGGLKTTYIQDHEVIDDKNYGRIFGSVQSGIANNSTFVTSVNSSKTSPIQSVFSHSANAYKPLQDINTLAGAYVKPVLSGDPNPTLPKYYKINMTVAGEIGTSAYSICRRNITGFTDSASTGFINNDEHIPFFAITDNLGGVENNTTPVMIKPYDDYHGGVRNNTRFIKINEFNIVSWDRTGVTVTNIITGKHVSYESINGVNLTDVRNCSVERIDSDSYKLYIACADKGLFVVQFFNINTSFGSAVINPTSTPCLSVDCGKQVFALFNQGGELKLRNSDDWGANLSFSLPLSQLSEGSIDSVYYIKADKDVTNNESINYVAICAVDSSNTIGLFWWDDNSSTTRSSLFSAFYRSWDGTNGIIPSQYWNTPFDVATNDNNYYYVNPVNLACDSRGNWYAWNSNSTFSSGETNTSNIIPLPSSEAFAFNIPMVTEEDYVLGKENIFYFDNGAFYKVASRDRTSVSCSGSGYSNAQERTSSNIREVVPVYLSKGSIFYNNGLCNPYYSAISNEASTIGEGRQLNQSNVILNPIVWDYYSYDGNDWIKTNPTFNSSTGVWDMPAITGRLTHSTDQQLEGIDSLLSLRWDALQGVSTPSEIGEWYSYVVCVGEMKDETNTQTYKNSWYLAKLIDATLTSTAIPTSGEMYAPVSLYGGSSPDDKYRSLEPDNISYYDLNIQGYSVAANIILDPNIEPGLNDILINTATGKLIFNSADIGKNVSGTYKYVQTDYSLPVPSINSLPSEINTIQEPKLILSGTEGLTLDGTNVVSWEDSSPRQIIYSQTEAANRPTTKTKNGNPVVAFDDIVPQWLEAEDYPLLLKNGISFVTAIRPEDADGGILSINHEIDYPVFGLSYDSTKIRIKFTNSGFYLDIPYTLPVDSWSLITASLNFNELKFTININGNTNFTGDIPKVPLFDAVTKVTLGRVIRFNNSTTSVKNFKGCIAYLSLYDNYLTKPELEKIQNYVNSLYAIY